MSGIQSFEDIVAWQKAREFTILIYKDFKDMRDFGFRDQVLRATISIMNNIAEGFDRGSKKELKQFLVIARGSAAEVRSMLIIAKDIGYLKDNSHHVEQAKEISRLLTGFIKTLD